jgi:DNA-nicking Smr family endonuclease
MKGEDRGRRMRRLSESERALWRKVQRSVRPLHGPPPPPLSPDPAADAGAPGRAGETGTAHTASSSAQPAPASQAGSAKRGGTRPPAAAGGSAGAVAPPPPAKAPRLTPVSAPAPASAPATASPSGIDRKTRRGLARGSVPVEARLDLHGLTQADAYRELRRFLVDAQARGLRHVLVITGKGRQPSETGEGGVLRRAVPEWLRQPELRPYVAMVGAAAAGHGGDGALYLRLARPGPPRRR